tara:strand:+ start:2376 stop:2618 length:243 start_codon:yes stop_codon:yes gene_type:complete
MLNKSDIQASGNMALEAGSGRTRIGEMMSFGWLGQTLASLCWILSVFTYGISSTGDWLQLLAASCWMVSNIATIVAIDGS